MAKRDFQTSGCYNTDALLLLSKWILLLEQQFSGLLLWYTILSNTWPKISCRRQWTIDNASHAEKQNTVAESQ